MPVLVGPEVASRTTCLLNLTDLARLSAASPSSFRLAGRIALQHQVANASCTEQTALYSLELKYFEADNKPAGSPPS